MSEQASEAAVDQAAAGTGAKTGTSLVVITTEVAEYQELADGLTAMYQRCHNMVYDLKTVAGDKQARSDRKQLVSARTALERRRVELNAKDRATIAERIALRDSEALRLESLVRALEQPISEQIAADEARREEERAARMKAEEDRCNAHRARINEISAVAVRAAGLSSAEIEEKHALVTRIAIDKSFEEFEAAAVNAKAECLLRLAELLSIAKQNEERAAQAERDRARLAELEEESRRNREREAAERRQREQQEAEQRRQREEQEAAARRADEIRKQQNQLAGEIVTKIGVIRRGALTASSADLLRMVTEVEAFQPGEECGDYVGIALRAKDEAIADLHAAHAVAVQREAEKREADERARLSQEAQRASQAALSEISGIQQQVTIAQMGRLGVRKGGTIECIRETLTETEAWPIDDRFGIHQSTAQLAKDSAVLQIKAMLKAAEDLAEQKRLADEVAKPAEVPPPPAPDVESPVPPVEPEVGSPQVESAVEGADPVNAEAVERSAEVGGLLVHPIDGLLHAAVAILKHASPIKAAKGKPLAFSVPYEDIERLRTAVPLVKLDEGRYYAADGTFMNADGTRNIFCDVDE